MGDRPWLDPGCAEGARALRPWLELQRHLALKPQAALGALASHGDPARVLRDAKLPLERLTDRPYRATCARLARIGVVGLPWGHPDYPEPLAALPDPPLLLWLRSAGDYGELLARPAVAIVGARAATEYGRRVAHALARDLARHLTVVSGLARGVDAAAHRGALETGATLAVLPCGPDLVYPASHRALAGSIAGAGILVSEFAPGAPPLRHHFPFRNRVISGLSAAVVVVEARARSGSLHTVDHALRQGREVLVVPGPVDAPNSEGTNALLRAGAAPVLDASDVLAAVGISSAAAPSGAIRPDAAPAHPLLQALRRAPASPDELVAQTGTDAAEVARELVRLELEGYVEIGLDGRAYATSLSSRTSGSA